MSRLTGRERAFIRYLTLISVLVGGISGFLLGGVAEAVFLAVVIGLGAFLGAWLTATKLAKTRGG